MRTKFSATRIPCLVAGRCAEMDDETTQTVSLCARCAAIGRTCCQGTDIFVTRGDIERISSKVGNKDFIEYRRPTDPSYLDQSDDPVWAVNVFESNGSRRVLRRDSMMNCCFLGAKGCLLSLDERPLVCRLYPYQYTAAGLDTSLAPGCPVSAVHQGLTLEQELHMSRRSAEVWLSWLYAEIQKGERE